MVDYNNDILFQKLLELAEIAKRYRDVVGVGRKPGSEALEAVEDFDDIYLDYREELTKIIK